MNTYIDYTLGGGRLYVLPGMRTLEELLASDEACAVADDVIVRREYEAEEICDEGGAVAATVVRLSRVSVEGTLLSLPKAAALLSSGGAGSLSPVCSAAYAADGVTVYAAGASPGALELVFGRRTPTGILFRLTGTGAGEIRFGES
jgi:hypothetical protein